MPLLLLLCLILACLPIEWPAPPFGLGPDGSAALTGSAVVSLLLIAKLFTVVTVNRLARDPGDREAVSRAHSLRRLVFFFLNLAGFGFMLTWCGWGFTANRLLTVDELLLPGAEILVLAPYLVTLLGSWAIFYDGEHALHRSSSDPAVRGEFWTRWGYVFFLFRYHVLMVFIPVGFTIVQFGILRVRPDLFEGPWAKLMAFAALFVFVLLVPSLVPLVLGLKRMPAGRLRERIEVSARRLGVRYHNLYVWHTHGNLATAMVAGLVPRLRQIVFTDLLLATLSEDEVEAVFGHEVGHVKHGHLLYYAAFLLLSFLTLGAVYRVIEQTPGLTPPTRNAALVLSAVATGAYLFLVFGFVSRRCERQADVFGCKSVSCLDPACPGHGQETALAAGGKALCRTGVGTFVRALERVEEINGMARGSMTAARRGLLGRTAGLLRFVGVWLGTWQHSTIANRVSFLRTLADDPQQERRFQRRVTALRWGLLVLLMAGVVVIIASTGWRSLLDAV
jgi:Zn-dependent protease with chaperone function